MGTTIHGLPYPEPTDQVSAGADAIRALAENIRIWSYTHTFASLTTSNVSIDVSYPAGLFTAAPAGVVSTGHSYAITNVATYATYFRLYGKTSSGSYNTIVAHIILFQKMGS